MERALRYVIPAVGILLLVGLVGGYLYATSIPAAEREAQQVLADEKYLHESEQAYADCHYTIKSNSEFTTATVVNQFYNQGAPKDKLSILEAQFLAEYTNRCDPVIADYESRFEQYKTDQAVLAKAKMTELDKLINKKPVVEKRPSDVFALYEKYDPKSLQYPVSNMGKMLYTADEFADYLNQNL